MANHLPPQDLVSAKEAQLARQVGLDPKELEKARRTAPHFQRQLNQPKNSALGDSPLEMELTRQLLARVFELLLQYLDADAARRAELFARIASEDMRPLDLIEGELDDQLTFYLIQSLSIRHEFRCGQLQGQLVDFLRFIVAQKELPAEDLSDLVRSSMTSGLSVRCRGNHARAFWLTLDFWSLLRPVSFLRGREKERQLRRHLERGEATPVSAGASPSLCERKATVGDGERGGGVARHRQGSRWADRPLIAVAVSRGRKGGLGVLLYRRR